MAGDILARSRIEQEQLRGAIDGVVGQVRELGRKNERVALPEKARRVGRNLNLLLGHELPGELAAVQVLVVRQSQQLPARYGLRHLEFEHHVAVLIGAQGGLPQGRFAEIGAGGDSSQVRCDGLAPGSARRPGIFA